MITHRDLALLQQAVYDHVSGSDDQTFWDLFEDGTGDNGVVFGIKKVSGVHRVALRGSDSPLDWARDLCAIPTPFSYQGLGHVHAGFAIGAMDTWKLIKAHVSREPFSICGHSLGGARADIITGLATLDGTPPTFCLTWGGPRAGGPRLREIISAVPAWRYRNGDGHEHDAVTYVPFPLPLFDFVHPSPLIDVHGPEPPERFGIFRLHHMSLYAAATPETAAD